jgi:hypothetical protein
MPKRLDMHYPQPLLNNESVAESSLSASSIASSAGSNEATQLYDEQRVLQEKSFLKSNPSQYKRPSNLPMEDQSKSKIIELHSV